tara:strand:- start:303 stop:626 length:324 start_codon:yes stop_codon:yes gene_type:complete
MLDYYGSIMKSKDDIYSDIISRFPNYSNDYIRLKIDHLYDTNYLASPISVSGWMVFVGKDVECKIKLMIEEELKITKLKLLLAKCLIPRNDINLDLIENISYNIKKA